MQKHYLKAPHDNANKGQPLPDRSNLAALYPAPKKLEILPPETEKSIKHVTPNMSKVKLAALFAGILIPLPFLLVKIFVELFISYGQTGDLLVLFALALFTFLGWSAFLFITYIKIHENLTALGISTVSFLMVHLSCLVLITPALFSLTLFLRGALQQIVFVVAITATSLLISEILCNVTFASWSHKIKNAAITALLAVCLAAALVYLVAHL